MYPPHTPDAFVALQDAINNSEFDDVKRNCLLYYLLKAWNDNRSALFAQAKAIPRQYVILSDGYYHLDTGSLEVSTALLFLKFPGELLGFIAGTLGSLGGPTFPSIGCNDAVLTRQRRSFYFQSCS